MDVIAMLIAALVGVALLAISIAHLLWSVGIMWPIPRPAIAGPGRWSAFPALPACRRAICRSAYSC